MGRLVPFLALLCLVSLSAASFQRPWENRSWVAANPNIWSYGVDYWWNLPELHKTIESVDFAAAVRAGVSGAAEDRLEVAAASAGKAEKDKNTCILETLSALGSPTVLYIKTFSETSSCVAYKRDWINSVDSTLRAVEESVKAAGKSVSDARESNEKMKFAGLCDSNYTGSGSGSCAELESAFYSVDSNISEGKYGKYALLLEYSNQLDSGLSASVPDLSLSATMLGLVWSGEGIIATFSSARDMAGKAVQDAESGFQERLKSASARKVLAYKSLEELEGEELGRIDKAPAGFKARKAGSVSERFEALGEEVERLEELFTEAKLEHGRTTEQSYLANAISGMAEADDGYATLSSALSALEDDAEEAVEQQRDEAETELSQTERHLSSSLPGPEASGLYEQAREEFDAGEVAGSLGERFVRYSNAAALARAARSAPGYEDELESGSSLASLGSLIERAETDQINVISEKENLKLLGKLPPYKAGDAIDEAISSIVAKARLKYEPALLATRARISDKLALAGPGAADLGTDMSNYEDGLIDDDGISFPDAIGSLRRLKSDYAELESTLDAYMSDIVGNAMSVSTEPLVSDVALDEPADIALDAVLANPRSYNATHVNAMIRMRAPVQFTYSDIVSGKDDVESIRAADGGKTLILSFPRVDAFETKRVVFAKKSVLAHTLSRVTSAEGIGGGAAHVKDEITLELDSDVSSLRLPGGFDGALIDGISPSGPAQRRLSAGGHTLLSERIVEDAYDETVENIKAYRIGTNSRVEYDIRIQPGMDLAFVPIFVDSINDSKISSLDISAATGELVKEKGRISETQYSAKILNLRKNRPAVLKVRYDVEDTKSFVEEQLARLDGTNMSAEAQDLIAQAKLQATAGNHTTALELIEKSVAVSRQDEKELAKLQKRCDELGIKLSEELSQLDEALSSTSDKTAPFMQKLAARKGELERLREDLEESGLNLTEKAAMLEAVDYKWLGKELNSFRKEAYSEYNDLKERFYLAGNMSTPAEFIRFEEALNRLETGGRLEYAAGMLEALQAVRLAVEAQEANAASAKEGLKSMLESVKSDVADTLERYSKQASAAKGTDYSSLFTESDKKISKLIDEAEDALEEDPRLLSEKINALDKSRERMELTLESLRNESESKVRLLEVVLEDSGLDESRKKGFAEKLVAMRRMVSGGDYVNALRAGSAIAKELDSGEREGNEGVLVLGVTALAALTAAGFYVAKQQKPKKELKRLTSFSAPALRAGPDLPREPAAPQEPQDRSSQNSQPPDQSQRPAP